MITLRQIANSRDAESLASRLRKERSQLLLSLLAELPSPVRIIDLGGTVDYWNVLGLADVERLEVTVVNKFPMRESPAGFEWIVGDARDLSQFDDKSFDVAFSNSVIEHVGTWSDQQRMASEVRRVGRRYFVQTPNRWFPIEPHFLFPGFQFLPESIKVVLLRRFSLGWFPRIPDLIEARAVAREIRLLTRSEVRKLFPDARIVSEKFCGLTKSFMAIKNEG